MTTEEQEVSFSVELTEAGVKAAARSRTISALDWLGGTFFRSFQQKQARDTAEQEAITEIRVKMIKEVGELALQHIRTDPEMARSAVEQQFGSMLKKEENKASALQHAIEDLRREPPTDQDSNSGPEELAEDVMGRWARYAEEATSEELRERWGRVLAAEIRKPGTFSRKVLRAVDEIDQETALLFERLCAFKLDDVLPRCLIDKITLRETALLTSADLLIEPGFGGQIRESVEMNLPSGEQFAFFGFGRYGIAVEQPLQLPTGFDEDLPLMNSNDKPAIPVYVLTEVGKAVSSILPDHEVTALELLRGKIATVVPAEKIRICQSVGKNMWKMVPSLS